jgi:hypothetical protein
MMMIQTLVRKLGLVCLCCGLGLATVYAIEDEAMEVPQETVQGTEDVAGEIPEVFADEEQVIPCDEHDEREECVSQRSEVRSRGLYNSLSNVPPNIPFKLVNERYGRCLRPTSKDDGAEVKLYNCANYSSRYWTPSNVLDAAHWTQLRNNWSGKCLKRSGARLIQVNCVNGYVTKEAIRQANRGRQYWIFRFNDLLKPLEGQTVRDAGSSPYQLCASSSTVWIRKSKLQTENDVFRFDETLT